MSTHTLPTKLLSANIVVILFKVQASFGVCLGIISHSLLKHNKFVQKPTHLKSLHLDTNDYSLKKIYIKKKYKLLFYICFCTAVVLHRKSKTETNQAASQSSLLTFIIFLPTADALQWNSKLGTCTCLKHSSSFSWRTAVGTHLFICINDVKLFPVRSTLLTGKPSVSPPLHSCPFTAW